MRFLDYDVILGLDIGNSKVCASVAKFARKSRDIELLGVGLVPSRGLSRGQVNDLKALSDSVLKAVRLAQQQAQLKVYSATVNLSNQSVNSGYYRQAKLLSARGRSVTGRDIKDLTETTKTLSLSPGEEVLHAIIKDYYLDRQSGIKMPVGMYGIKLEAKIFIVKALDVMMQNIAKSCDLAGLHVRQFVYSGLADAHSLADKMKQDRSPWIIADIGRDFVNMAFIDESGSLSDMKIIPTGSGLITDIIAEHYDISLSKAEQLKKNFPDLPDKKDVVNEDAKKSGGEEPAFEDTPLQVIINGIGGICADIKHNIDSAKFKIAKKDMPIYFAGGITLLDGFMEQAENTLGMPVLMAVSRGINAPAADLSNPLYTTSFGLVKYASSMIPGGRGGPGTPLRDFAIKAKDFLEEYF
jgi:cell division protein FtsA